MVRVQGSLGGRMDEVESLVLYWHPASLPRLGCSIFDMHSKCRHPPGET